MYTILSESNMKRLTVLLTVFTMSALLLIMGCDTRSPSGTNGGSTSDVAGIQLLLPTDFKAPAGVQTVEIQAVAVNANGQGIPDIALEFILNPGHGSIQTTDSVTNASGVFTANYIVDVQETIIEEITVKVINTSIQTVGNLTISLLDQIIQSVDVISTDPVLYLGTQSGVTDTLIATVVDTNNNGIEGLLVNFSTLHGTIGNIPTTDINGNTSAIITFSSDEIPSTENAITTWVYAMVGGKTDSTKITVIRQQNDPTEVALIGDPAYMLLAQTTQGTANINTFVTDENGNGVAGITVNYSVSPTNGVNLTPADLTDASGFTFAVVQSYARPAGDSLRVVATVNVTTVTGDVTLADTTYITFAPLEETINSIYVWAEPAAITGTQSAAVFARVLDNTNTAIQFLAVDFNSDKGALTPPSITDSTGVAMVNFFANGDTGLATITASAGGMSNSAEIQINQSGTNTGSLFLSSNKTVIYADGNVTYASLTAILKNADNEPISMDTVRFTSYPPYTSIASPAITDSTGKAYSTFDDIGAAFYTEPDSALITAKYAPLGLEATLSIIIKQAPLIDHIVLTSQGTAGMMGDGSDTTEVLAQVYLADGNFAPEGTPVNFSATLGELLPADTIVSESGGQATVKFRSASTIDTAFIVATTGGVESNQIAIPFIPGDPTDIELISIVPAQLIVGGPSGTLTVMVKDTVGNGVPNQQVTWSSSLGTITSLSISNIDGLAMAFLSPQTEAGISQITAYAQGVGDTATFGVPIVSGFPSSIQLSSDVNTIQVQGTGGQEAATLTANVSDPNGNPAPDSVMVVFEILSPIPTGSQFDNGLPIDSALTSNGISRVSLNSGSASGTVKIQATTWRDWPNTSDPITAIKSNLVIASGPPVSIDIDYNPDVEMAAGNEWEAALTIEITARVADAYGNNVSEGTAVFFSIDPTEYSIWHGPFAHIDGSANLLDSTGICVTNLYYNSEDTYKDVNVIAEANSEGGTVIYDTTTVPLPLFGGELTLNVIPESWSFTADEDVAVLKCVATLNDDIGHVINNALIVYSTSAGLFFCADSEMAYIDLALNWWPDYEEWRFENYTGPNPIDIINLIVGEDWYQGEGQSILFMRAEIMENTGATGSTPNYPGVFIDLQTPELIIEVAAAVAGSAVASDPVNVTFRRVLN